MSVEHLRSLGQKLERLGHELYMINQALVQKALELDRREEMLVEMENRLYAEHAWVLPSTPQLERLDSFSLGSSE